MEFGKEVICERCGYPIAQCKCKCPFCDETVLCDCCIGHGVATGG